jgi:uncharacterized membrane protein YdjX (TVP38/TMEM64 family)
MQKEEKNILYFIVLGGFAVLPSLISGTAAFYLYEHRTLLSHSSWTAYLLFFSASVFTMAFALTPTTFVAILSGYFFGWGSFPLLVTAYLTASVLGLWFGRLLKKLNIELRSDKGSRFLSMLKTAEDRQFAFIFFARLSPVLPFAMTNIGLSSLRIEWIKYLSASLLGMFPRTAVFFYAGKNAGDIWSFVQNPTLEGFQKILPVVLIVVSTLGLLRVFRKKEGR